MNIRHFKTALYITAACVSALLSSSPVRAQQSTEATVPQQQSAGLEEIIVTARKREESLLDVPVIETAVPKIQLERMQVTSLSDLATIVPGVEFAHSTPTEGTFVSIRGIGTVTSDPGVDSAFLFNIDGLDLGIGLAFNSGLFDVEQVE